MNNSGGGALASAWTLSATGPTPISGTTGTPEVTAVEVTEGAYTLGETGPGGYIGTWECTITNTVFFEGIPALNQYGMAILTLLMPGLGVVGMRRFV